jgi:protein SCO1/2
MNPLPTLILCIALLFAGCSQPPSFKSTDISGADWGKELALTDHHGQPRRLADFKGKAVVVFFGYTSARTSARRRYRRCRRC